MSICRLEANIGLEDDHLLVTYQVFNTSDKPLYLVDHLFWEEPSGKRHPDYDVWYTIHKADTAILSKRFFETPQHIETDPIIPYVTEILANHSHKYEGRISLPLIESYPHKAKSNDKKTVSVTNIHIELGYIPYDGSFKARHLSIQGTSVLKIPFIALLKNQKIIKSQPFKIACKIIV